MLNTFYRKLSVALFLLVCITGLVFFAWVRYSTQMYQQELSQKLHQDLAAHIADSALLIKDQEINQAALKDIFHMLMVINPSIEVYLLDEAGAIIAFSAPTGKVILKQVDLRPIKLFLQTPVVLPIDGDDPRNIDRKKIFSASRIPRSGPLQGYLYVILGGERYDSTAEMLRNSFIIRNSMWGLIASGVLTLAIGLLFFALLTRRLRRLSTAMDGFSNSDYNQGEFEYYQIDGKPRDDIDRLGQHFNSMASRITAQIQALKRSDQLRRELVANVSHDLRTPLATLHGYLETLILKDASLSAVDRKHYLETAVHHSLRLGKLVAELFDLAKLDSCETILYAEPFSLLELIQDVIQKFQLQAQEKNITLAMDFGSKIPHVYGDIAMMQRVLENLLVNALRYTPAGGRICIGLLPKGERITVKISDTGCGIPKAELAKVFDRFYRLEKSRRDHSDSAGLGLAITKRICELHGSSIQVFSELNRGTTFEFNLAMVR